MADREVGSIYIRVRPDARRFRREAQDQIGRRPIYVDGHVETDRSQVDREVDAMQRQADRRTVKVDGELDIDDTLRSIERSMGRMGDLAESMNLARRELEAMRRDLESMARSMTRLNVEVNREQFDRLRDDFEELRAEFKVATGDAQRTLETFRSLEEGRAIDVPVEADLNAGSFAAARSMADAMMPSVSVRARLHMASFLGAMAQIQTLGSRPQYVDIRPRIPAASWLAMEAQLLAMSRRRVARMASNTFDRVWRTWAVGGFRSMAGLGDMDEMLHAFDRIISRMDVVGTQAAVMGTAIGSAVNVGVHALGGMIVTLADVTRAFGLAAAGPSLLLAGIAGLQTHRSIWGDFRTALDEIKEAEGGVFESLPENAQRAVLAIDALNRAINKSVQDGFWGVMTDEIERFAETVGPTLERGMSRTAEVYGETMSSMLDLAQEWAESGQLGAAFSNINRMFEGVGAGVVQFFDAFVTVGMRASRMMPRLGHEFEQLGQSLNNYMHWASEMGMLEYWIESGVNVMTQLIRAGGAVGEMAQGLTQAFRNAGITGLPAFVSGMEAAAEVMQSPVWQFRMGNMFEGMVEGARDVWRGVSDINSVLYESHEWVRRLSMSMGTAGGEFLSRIADVLGNLNFQEGMVDLFDGFTDMLVFLETGADHFGDILGSLGTIGGEILRETAPGIETLLGIFSDAATSLTPLIVSLIDPLTQFIDNLGHTVRHNVNNIISPALGLLIEGFLSLPPLMQNMIALGAAMSRWMPAFGQAASRAMAGLGRAIQGTSGSMLRLTDADRAYRRSLQQHARNIPGAIGTMARLNNQYQRTGQLIQGTYRPMSNMRVQMQNSAREAGNLQRAANTAFRGVGANVASAIMPVQRFDRALTGVQQSMERMRTTGDLRTNQMGGATLFAPMHREMDRIERRSSNLFRGLGTGLASQISAAGVILRTGLASAFATAAAAGRGLLGVVRGIYSLLGGLPGLILIGAISAIGHFRGEAAEARREVEGLARAMETGDSFTLMEEISQIEGMREALATLEQAGIDATYVLGDLALGKDVSGLVDGFSELQWVLDDLNSLDHGTMAGQAERFIETGFAAETMSDRLKTASSAYEQLYGATMQEHGLDRVRTNLERMGDMGHVAETIEHVSDAIAEAEGQAALADMVLKETLRTAGQTGNYRQLHQALLDNGEGYAQVTEEAGHFAQAVARANEEGATTDARIQGVSQALRVLRGDYQEFGGTGYEAWDRQNQAIRTATEAAEANGTITDELIIGNGRLASSSEAYAVGQEKLHLAHQAVNEVLEGQIALGLEAYDAAIANGEGHVEATRAASEAFNNWDDSIDAVIDTLGLTGEAADAVRGEMEALAQYQDFEMILTMSGLTEEEIGFAYDGLERIRMTGQEIDGAEWAAFISANPEQALTAAYDIQRAYENMLAYNYVVELGANADTAFGVFAEAIGMGDEYATGEYSAILHAMTEGATMSVDELTDRLMQYDELSPEAVFSSRDEASELAEQIIALGDDWDASEHTAHFGENGLQTLEESLDGLTESLLQLERTWLLQLQEQGVEGASERLKEVEEQLGTIDGHTARPFVSLTDEANGALEEIQENLDTLNNGVASPEAKLEAEQFFGEEGRARELLETFPNAEAVLEAYDNASDKTQFVQELLRKLGLTTARPVATLNDETEGPIGELQSNLDVLDNSVASPEAKLEAEQFFSEEGRARELLATFPDAEAWLEAYDNASDKTQFVRDLLDGIDEMRAEADIDANDEASGKAEGALTTLGMIDGSWWANLFANDEVSGTAEGAKSSVESVPESWWSRFLGSDLVSGIAGTVGGSVRGVPSIWRSLFTGSDSTSGVAGGVLGAIRGVPTLWSSLFSGRDGVSGIAGNVGRAIGAVPGSKLSAFIGSDGTSGPAGAAKGAVEDIPGSWATTLSIMQQMMYVRLAILAMRATQAIPRSWSSLLRLIGSPRYVAQAMAARRAIQSVPRSWYSRITVTSNAWAAASSARAAINSVRSRSVTITTRRRTVTAAAEGGVFEGSGRGLVQQFANGGMRENHTAKIYKASADYRVFAEPETGGEAYIPLAASKRARSTAIWEETGKRLGVFADGGITGARGGASAPDGPTFNITNNYPQAEPTSRTVARSMEQLGSGAGGRW